MGKAASSLVIVTTFLVFVGTASADETTPASSANETAAIQKFDEGRKLLEAGNHAAALAAFDASNKLLASPNSLLYMARCHKALGQVASAFTTFRLAYKHAQDRLVATGDKRYTATRDTAASEAAAIEADVPKLAIVVPADAPAGIVVKQNGNVVSPALLGSAIDTDPGHVTIDATGPRLAPFHEELDLATAETKRIDVKLTRIPTATIALRLRSRPLGLAIRVDGNPVDPSELANNNNKKREVDPGPRVIDASAPGHKPFHWERTVNDREDVNVDVDLEEESTKKLSTPPWMFWTSSGAAVGLLATGTILAVHANGRSNDENDKNPFLRDPNEKSSIQTESTVANVFFISGAVFGVAAVALAFTTDWKKKEEKPQNVQVGFMNVRGRF